MEEERKSEEQLENMIKDNPKIFHNFIRDTLNNRKKYLLLIRADDGIFFFTEKRKKN